MMRLHHYSIHTERTYVEWIKRYVRFHHRTCREDLAGGEGKIEAFQTDLAIRGKVAPATQNQAMNALVFLWVVNKAIKVAARRAGLVKVISAPSFRHSFATHLLQRGTDIRRIQALLGRQDVATKMIDTHILQQGGHGVASPLDDLQG